MKEGRNKRQRHWEAGGRVRLEIRDMRGHRGFIEGLSKVIRDFQGEEGLRGKTIVAKKWEAEGRGLKEGIGGEGWG
jgi:hypothetical protein